MRQTKTISLSESQRAWLKEFSEKHHFKESEVVQMLINKASIDDKLQEILVDKITAKKEGIKKTEVTSHNVQIVKEKDASKPIIRDISAKDNIPQKEEVITDEELDWFLASTKKDKNPDKVKELWMAFVKADPKKAEEYKAKGMA